MQHIKMTKTRLAIAVWQSRISPVFDTAGHLLVLDVENGQESRRSEYSLFDLSLQKRVDKLAELEVDVLLCGAISRQLADMVAALGIRTIPWMKGNAEDVLNWYLAEKPVEPRMLLPGCRQRHRFMGPLGRSRDRHMRDYPEKIL